MRKQGRLAAIAVLCVGMFASAEASAHTEKTKTAASVEFTGSAFEANVESSGSCIKNRKVSLFRRGENGSLGKVSTDTDGNAVFSGLARVNGDYYVKVSRKVLKKNDKHKHLCKPAKSRSNQDALVRDCDEVKLFDGSGGDGSTNVDVDDDLTVDVDGERRYTDLDDFANSYPPISIGPVSFGESIHIVAINGVFGGPFALDPLWVECTSTINGGSAVLDATGVPDGGSGDPGFVFYDESFPMPVTGPPR
jgi:hypothetical protein